MKIAIYAICKNESKFIERFVDSCYGADYIVICDTGSTDDTEDVVKSLDQDNIIFRHIKVDPWRFDVARNMSLVYVPNDVDICICLDLDEILSEGWRETLERAYHNIPDTTRFRYNYIWSHNDDGSVGVSYYADKIHKRHGYYWELPVHETLAFTGEEVQTFIPDTLITHYPDYEKSRAQYLPLLELSVSENPDNDRALHYLGREYMFVGQYHDAINTLVKHLKIATWASERAASYRFIGRCLWALGMYNESIKSFVMATKESPDEREGWVELAQGFRAFEIWDRCLEACNNALKITERPNLYINEPVAWSDWPMQMKQEALEKLNDRNTSL